VILVVDVSSFAGKGYVGSSSFEGERVDVRFDDADEGLTLSKQMCDRAGLRKGSPVTVSVEAESRIEVIESTIAGVSDDVRFSSSKLYYLVGGLGGAIIKIQRA